jgi:hypothetical protein
LQRFSVCGSAGQRDGNRWAVVDNFDKQGGKGIKRVSFHRTFAAAQREAKRMNAAEKEATS